MQETGDDHAQIGNITILTGDSLKVLAQYDADTFDTVVTDPPYGIGFMGKDWDKPGSPAKFQEWMTKVGRELFRVLKPGGHVLMFGGTRTYHRVGCALEDAGFEIRDSIHWTYGSGFPKSLNVGKAIDKAAEAHHWDGWGTALKPSHEPIVLARKPLAGTVAGNVLEYGTGALNIDGCRVGAEGSGRWPANTVLTHAADCVREGSRTDDITLCGEGNDNLFHGNFQGGHDKSPRSATTPVFRCAEGCPAAVLDKQSGQSKSAKATMSKGFGVGDNVYGKGDPSYVSERGHDDAGGASRYFTQTTWNPELDALFLYQAKPSRRERNAGLDGLPEGPGDNQVSERRGSLSKPRANTHPTVKPVELMRWLIRLATPPGGTILDPFAGSGTTGVAAVLENVSAVLVERETEYAHICALRVGHAAGVRAPGHHPKAA